jgi:hypothetical protein
MAGLVKVSQPWGESGAPCPGPSWSDGGWTVTANGFEEEVEPFEPGPDVAVASGVGAVDPTVAEAGACLEELFSPLGMFGSDVQPAAIKPIKRNASSFFIFTSNLERILIVRRFANDYVPDILASIIILFRDDIEDG